MSTGIGLIASFKGKILLPRPRQSLRFIGILASISYLYRPVITNLFCNRYRLVIQTDMTTGNPGDYKPFPANRVSCEDWS